MSEKLKRLRYSIKDDRINIEDHYFKPTKTNDKIKGTIIQKEGYKVKNCFILSETIGIKTITHYVTIHYDAFTLEEIKSLLNTEIIIFNKRHNTNIKQLES